MGGDRRRPGRGHRRRRRARRRQRSAGPVTSEDLFAAVIGQNQAVAKLRDAAIAPVHAYLLAGPPDSGKREAARAFAATLLCRNGGDGTCRNCRLALAGEHPDVREVVRSGPAITMDQARDIVTLASRTPVEGERK